MEPSLFIAVLLFIVPESNKKEGLLTWDVVPKIPWGIILLFVEGCFKRVYRFGSV
jgi:di/tricarboxylate transporter